VAFDIDGVLADMEGELARQADVLFGRRLHRAEAADGGAADPAADIGTGTAVNEAALTESEAPIRAKPFRLTSRQRRELWRHIGAIENFWATLREIEPGTVRRLAEVAAARRWEILFLTRRPATAGATAQRQTQEWLEALGFRLPSVYVVQRSRGKIAAALGLDIVVDDRPENCLDVVVDSKARAILVARSPATAVPSAADSLGIGVVTSVRHCLDVLIEADDPLAGRAGVLDRVRRLFGLEPAR
jgi:hypothetical protein